MDLLLPDEGRILDVGAASASPRISGARTEPGRRIVGVDPNARRIDLARYVAKELGLLRHEFRVGDARRCARRTPSRARTCST
ncbi:MAG: hypothetical protein U0235_15795 [Polyangiaceae bacterium]